MLSIWVCLFFFGGPLKNWFGFSKSQTPNDPLSRFARLGTCSAALEVSEQQRRHAESLCMAAEALATNVNSSEPSGVLSNMSLLSFTHLGKK